MFRASKLGPLIGERTWGGLVGIDEIPNLVDGGMVTAPSAAIYDPNTGEIIAENQGVDPDVEVDRRPDEVANGIDGQLESAIKYLMDELAKHPRKVKQVDVPVVGPRGRIGG
jgi:tricorn protease